MRIRHFLILSAVTLSVAFGPPERTTPAKWALVVGISDYTHFGDEIGGDLPGAANDARAVADVLVNRYGFAPENVKLVLDGAATRDRLQSELSGWLPSVARPGDLVWFYFAGHGSQAWDMDGDEEDGLDETVCPADVMRGNTEMDILDDEIGVWLNQLPTDNVVVVWDKCHAKSSTRAVTPLARPRSLDRKTKQDVPEPENRAAAPAKDLEKKTGSGILEIASAQADEVAIDAAFPSKEGGEPTYGGAFTTPFVQNLWNADENATYSEIFTKTKHDMRRNRFRQQPDIDEKELKDRPLFWTEAAAPAVASTPAQVAAPAEAEMLPAAPVGSARILDLPSATEAILSGGFNADMTARSIYRAGNDILEVVDVDPDRATARITTRETRGIGVVRGDNLAKGAAARLVAYRYPEPMLQVMVGDLNSHVRAALRSRLTSVPSLMLVEDARTFAHLMIRSRNGHHVVLGLDGFPRDSVIVGSDAANQLAALLKREYGQYQLAELENPAQPFRVDFAFGNGRNDFMLGETVSFVITSEREGYLTIVDLAPDGTVSVIFPNEYVVENRVYAGRATQFPAASSNLQFAAVEPAGRGIIRAFITERPIVMPFSQGADATEAGRLWTALRNAAGRPPLEGSDAIPVDSWATSAIVYEIRGR